MVKPLFCCSDYLVDSRGFVLSKKKGTPLKYSLNPRGYCIINLMINGKPVGLSVHSAVAHTFLDGYEDGLQVNHIDGNKENNDISNLEWATPKQNTQHAINVLGFNRLGGNNPQSKTIYGYDKKTHVLRYTFKSLIDCGRFFSNGDENKARHIQNIVSQIANHSDRRKSYRGCIWEFS